MKTLIAIIALTWSLLGYAENTNTLECQIKNSEWEAVFKLTDANSGLLEFKRLGVNKPYVCGLKVIWLKDMREAQSKNVEFNLKRATCNPKIGELKQEISDEITIIIDFLPQYRNTGRVLWINENPIASRVQWLKQKQSENCVTVKMNMFGISRELSGLED